MDQPHHICHSTALCPPPSPFPWVSRNAWPCFAAPGAQHLLVFIQAGPLPLGGRCHASLPHTGACQAGVVPVAPAAALKWVHTLAPLLHRALVVAPPPGHLTVHPAAAAMPRC